MSLIIGVASQAQHGKDTLADKLCEILLQETEVKWIRSAFASNVKRVYCSAFDVDSQFIETWKIRNDVPPGFDMPVRKSLQFIGDGFRKIRQSIWMDLVFVDKQPKIISDVRYINEFKRVKKERGLNILIGRTNRLNRDPNGSEAEIRPYVEWCLKNFDANFVDLKKEDCSAVYWRNKIGPLKWGKISAPDNIKDFDVFVRNDGTIQDLYDVIKKDLVPYVKNFQFNQGEE